MPLINNFQCILEINFEPHNFPVPPKHPADKIHIFLIGYTLNHHILPIPHQIVVLLRGLLELLGLREVQPNLNEEE